MRILIFAEAFTPPAYSPRLRYFCNCFTEKGWTVDMVVENSDFQHYIPENINICVVNYYKYKKSSRAKTEWLFKFIVNLIFDYKGFFFYKKSKHFLKGKQYDAVFCSSSFTFPLTTAALLANKLHIPLFVDLRDIAEQSPDDYHYLANKPPKYIGGLIARIFKNVNVRRRNRVLRSATAATTISPWHVETLKQYNHNTFLIYNGFDEKVFFPTEQPTEKFTISYFGRIFNEQMRNPTLLFEALNILYIKNILTSENTVIKWYVDDVSKEVIENIAKRYHLESFVEYYAFVPPANVAAEMNKSSVLMILCNVTTQKNYFGIMTTKFFEAIGVNKPVLCIPDNQDNLSELIRESKCGLVSSEVEEVETFLLNKFLEWKENSIVNGSLSETVRMDFSRKKGAEILERIILDNVKPNSIE